MRHAAGVVVVVITLLTVAVPAATAAPAPTADRAAAVRWLRDRSDRFPSWLFYASFRSGGVSYIDFALFNDGSAGPQVEIQVKRGRVVSAHTVDNITCWIGQGHVRCSST